jgi:hypothetical protein
MSIQPTPHSAPVGAGKSGSVRIPASVLGAIAGVGLLFLSPGQARADRGYSSGHAEITLGFPHGQVTVGKTWDDHPPVVVEEVTHKLPADDDWDDEDEDQGYDEESDEPDHVIIEHREQRPCAKKVTIIEHRYAEPVHCDREVRVVRKVYLDRPACERSQVVVYGGPTRVIHAPSRTVIVSHGNGGYRDHDGFRGDRGTVRVENRGPVRVDDRGGHGGDRGPRDLFPEDRGRPMRARGVQQHLVQVGASR